MCGTPAGEEDEDEDETEREREPASERPARHPDQGLAPGPVGHDERVEAARVGRAACTTQSEVSVGGHSVSGRPAQSRSARCSLMIESTMLWVSSRSRAAARSAKSASTASTADSRAMASSSISRISTSAAGPNGTSAS